VNVSPWVGVVTAAPGESGADVVEATAGGGATTGPAFGAGEPIVATGDAAGMTGLDAAAATAGKTPGEGLGGDDAADATSMTGGAKGGASGNGFVPGADPFCTTE